MASFGDPKIITLPLGAFDGATAVPLAYVPSEFGGMTVLDAYLSAPGAGTVTTGVLITMTNPTSGTPVVSGTIGAFAASVVTVATKVFPLTISDAYVAADEWIGFDQASGTVPAGSFISLTAVMGRSGS